MRILLGTKKRVDFEAPIKASECQREKLINFFKSIFDENVVKEEPLGENKEFRFKRLGDKPGPRYPRWIKEEKAVLLNFKIEDDAEIAKLIGRSETAVYMARGPAIARFMSWTGDKNISDKEILEDIRELIEEFLNYEEEQKRKRRKEKKDRNVLRKKIDEKVISLRKKLNSQKLLKNLKPNNKEIDEAIKETLREIKEAEKKLEEYNDL